MSANFLKIVEVDFMREPKVIQSVYIRVIQYAIVIIIVRLITSVSVLLIACNTKALVH